MKSIVKVSLFLVFGCGWFLSDEAQAFSRFIDDADIPTWAVESVYMAKEAGIMTGFGDKTFRPSGELNRAEALVTIFRAKKIDVNALPEVSADPFPDVPRNAWFARAVAEGVKKGWINGFPNGTFRPSQALNRAEWATLVMRAFGLTKQSNPGFQDVPSNAWYTKAVFALADNELIREKSMNFMPSGLLTRADAAWVMAQILNKSRLTGESKTSNVSAYARRTDSRRVAIKPRNFNPNLQGYVIEPKKLKTNVVPHEDKILIRKDSDWINMGEIHVKNTLKDRVLLHSLEFKLVFEKDSIGPEENFYFRIKGEQFSKEILVGHTGNIFIAGIEKYITSGEEKIYTVFLKPKKDAAFFRTEGTGTLSFFQASASMISSFMHDDQDKTGNYRFAPIGFEGRKFTPITFRP